MESMNTQGPPRPRAPGAIGRLVGRYRVLVTGFVAQVLQYGSALLMLPFLASRLSPAEMGVWYLFVTIQGLALIADFGFQYSFSRSFSIAFSGGEDLRAEGVAENGGGEPNLPLVAQTLAVARRLYLGLALAVFAVLATAGLLYVVGVARASGLDAAYVGRSWLIYALGVALGLYFLWLAPLLIGSGRIEANYRYLIIARGGFAVSGIVVLLAGGRLTALAIALVATDLVARASVWRTLRPMMAALRRFPVLPGEARRLFQLVWPNASRMGLVALATFLILRFSVFVVATYLGLAVAASYSMSLQLVNGVTQVALLPMAVLLPNLVAAHVRRDRRWLRARWLRGNAAFLAVFLAGAAAVVLAGDPLLRLIGARTTLLPTGLLALLFAIGMLDGLQTLSVGVILAGNKVPFMVPALVSGVAVAGLGMLAGSLGLGLLGVIAAQGLVQLCYNNWRWPLMVYRDTAPDSAL